VVDFALVQSALDGLLPAMVADGGGAELVSLNDGVATVRLLGTCNFCPSRRLSAAALRRQLQARVPELLGVSVLYPSAPEVVPDSTSTVH
jgi:Fe-S cluster biogenesis protein NfuA